MARTADIQAIRDRLGEHPGPILSVYVNANPARPENQGQAYVTRLKNEFGRSEVPEDLKDRVLDAVEGEQPGGRTLVLFAAEDGLFERYALQIDLPEAYRYGEPYLAPLVLAFDENERYGFAVLDAEEFRFFVNSPVVDPSRASGEEVSGFYRELDVSPNLPHPRGGRDYEPTSRRTEAHVSQFYNELGKLTRQVAFREGVKHLVLAGPKERTSEFRDRLPKEVQELVVLETHFPHGAPEGELMERLERAREEAERERSFRLISEARERGVRGVKDTLQALQEGRVHHVLALWNLDAEVRWSDADEWVMTGVEQKESPYSGESTRVRPVIEVLVELASARGARLEFLQIEDEVAGTPNEDLREDRSGEDPGETLLREFGGLVGLLRY